MDFSDKVERGGGENRNRKGKFINNLLNFEGLDGKYQSFSTCLQLLTRNKFSCWVGFFRPEAGNYSNLFAYQITA